MDVTPIILTRKYLNTFLKEQKSLYFDPMKMEAFYIMMNFYYAKKQKLQGLSLAEVANAASVQLVKVYSYKEELLKRGFIEELPVFKNPGSQRQQLFSISGEGIRTLESFFNKCVREKRTLYKKIKKSK